MKVNDKKKNKFIFMRGIPVIVNVYLLLNIKHNDIKCYVILFFFFYFFII